MNVCLVDMIGMTFTITVHVQITPRTCVRGKSVPSLHPPPPEYAPARPVKEPGMGVSRGGVQGKLDSILLPRPW